MALKLEQEGTCVRLEFSFSVESQDKVLEHLGVKKPWIRLSGRRSIARMQRIGGNGEFFPHLEAHLKVFGDLSLIVLKLVGDGRSVECRIVAYGPKQWLALILILAILAQTLAGKRALGILPMIDLV